MKISRLYQQHERFKHYGLADSWGDGYLVHHNRLYRGVREAALKLGYKFSSEKNDAYTAFPLLQLETILKRRVLPYADNSSVFGNLSVASREALSWDDVDGNLRKNFVFHEASHAVVRELVLRHLGPRPSGQGLVEQQGRVLRMLFEESCANAVELLGVLDVGDQTHRAFYETNSYICMFQDRTHLSRAVESFGFAVVFRFIVLAYLQANFLRTQFEENDFNLMLAISRKQEWRAEERKTFRALGKIAFQLSERFREQTTGFHIRLEGIDTPLDQIFAFKFLNELEGQEGLDPFFTDFVKLTGPQ